MDHEGSSDPKQAGRGGNNGHETQAPENESNERALRRSTSLKNSAAAGTNLVTTTKQKRRKPIRRNTPRTKTTGNESRDKGYKDQ